MKKLSLLLMSFFLLGGVTVNAQSLIPDQNKKGKWGFVNEDGKKVINYDYNEVTAFVDGRAKVKKGDKWGYIDMRGKEVIKIKYSEMLTWNGNYCKVAEGGSIKDGVLKGAKWGFINRNGDEVLKSEYDEIGAFKNGIAHVVKGGKYGYIDDNYRILIPCKFAAIGVFNEYGYCWVNESGKIANGEVTGGRYGVYNTRGEEVIKPRYGMLGTFTITPIEANPMIANAFNKKENVNPLEMLAVSESGFFNLQSYKYIEPKNFSELDMSKSKYIAVSNYYPNPKVKRDFTISRMNFADKVGIIDENGTIIVPPGKFPIVYFPVEGLAPVAKLKKDKLQINYYNVKTEKLLFKKWIEATSITPFENGTAIIADGSNQYLIDENGNTVSSVYNLILPLKEGLRIVKRGDQFGMVDESGKETIPCSYNVILPLSEGMMCVQKEAGGTVGYMDKFGQYKIEPKFLGGQSFKNGAAVVHTMTGAGMIDVTGKQIIAPSWVDVLAFSEPSPELAWVKNTGGLWECISVATGKRTFENTFFGVSNFNSNGVAYVSNSKGLIGAVSKKGEIVIPMFLNSADKAEKCYQYLVDNGKAVMTDVEVYRFNLNYEPARNEYRLTEKIANNLWDF